MGRLLGLLFCLVGHICVFANDDDQLADFSEIPLEIDRDFIDDFDEIEALPKGSLNEASIIQDSFEWYSARDITRREKSLSIFGGDETIASIYYLTLFPQGKFLVWTVFGHLGLPLRFSVYDNVGHGQRGIRKRGFFTSKSPMVPRPKDFKSFWDIHRGIRHFEIGEKKNPHFLRLSRSHAITLGQGELVKDLSPDGLYDAEVLLLSGHTQWDRFRVNGFLAPIFKAELLGLSARFTPLVNTTTNAFVNNLNVDLTYVGDFLAPNEAITQDGVYVLSSDQQSVKRHNGTAQGASIGIANEWCPFGWLSLKPYVSYGHLWLTGALSKHNTTYGSGLHVGHEANLFFTPNSRQSILTLKTEARLFSSKYFPAYFGSTYLIDRISFYAKDNEGLKTPLTKSQFLAQEGDGRFRVGYLMELGYAWDSMAAAVLGYESAHSFVQGNVIIPMRKLYLTMSLLGLDLVKIYAGYQATSLAQMKELFDFEKSRALISIRGQLKILPFLYFDSWVKHSFGINDMFTSEGSEENGALWLSSRPETQSLNFGLGVEFAMTL